MNRRRNLLLKYLLRTHPRDDWAEKAGVLRVLNEEVRDDDFSLSQWEIGLTYYRDRFEAFKAPGGLLLDLGCGTGNWSIAGSTWFDRVIGIDVRNDRLKAACRLRDLLNVRNVAFGRGDLTALPFPSGEANCVLAYNVLPYVRDWDKAISEIERVLRPGGMLWCSWQDVGILLFYFAECLILGRPDSLMAAVAARRPRWFRRRSGERAARVYLSAKEVREGLLAHGFDPVWKSNSPAWPSPARPLFPQRMLGLPFFHEVLALKRSGRKNEK
ncbi:MAG: class I SAM-dependent methyltransferase [Candidatus Eisenbacteria bacterium]|nr:class I SAM-dependent methyltransferase [Candidatus Eisenbacteria bacterium]